MKLFSKDISSTRAHRLPQEDILLGTAHKHTHPLRKQTPLNRKMPLLRTRIISAIWKRRDYMYMFKHMGMFKTVRGDKGVGNYIGQWKKN